MLTTNDIIEFCNTHNYDIKKTGNARWIDQKCTFDVTMAIADCILNFTENEPGKIFTTKDIWLCPYTVENIENIFKKPDVSSNAAKNEYDKFFQQPMELFAAAGILGKIKKGGRNFYHVLNRDLLEYISLREKNSLLFLQIYIEKTLKDSGIIDLFNDFFKGQNKDSYKNLKQGFSDFIINNTPINGETECNRIFIKVLNPLAYSKGLKGTEHGNLSKDNITYDMLMYNRYNFRDTYSDKPKQITRKEHDKNSGLKYSTEAYYKYLSNKAVNYLKKFNNQYRDGLSEHIDEYNSGDAAQIHHIFPKSEFPEISYCLENLIALTPTQHLNFAHPKNKTDETCKSYQKLLLLSKTDRIKENIENSEVETIYDFSEFLQVLKTGLNDERFLKISTNDFEQIKFLINQNYSKY